MSTDPRIEAPQDINADLGFGSVVARESRARFLNRDGTFNVRRRGFSLLDTLSAYHYLLTISWLQFIAMVSVGYVVTNALFAWLFVMTGDGGLAGITGTRSRFLQSFFFSVHTLATIGYGNIVPVSLSANILVTIESLIGLLGFALVAGIVFARFARPVARLVFSEQAVIAPYRGGRGFMFRVINQKTNELVELDAKVILARRKDGGGLTDREFNALKLEREHVVFFPLAWTIVHPIDESSPLWGVTAEDLAARDAEFLVLINGFDETFSQTVHTRSSYKASEIVWGAKFRSMFLPHKDGDQEVSVDIRTLHDIERVEI